MKYIATIDTDEKPVSCEFIGCNGNVQPYSLGTTNDIKILDQEPCDDCISRQVMDEVKELMTDINGHTVYAVKMSDIRQLPPVNPQEPKTGHWIDCDNSNDYSADGYDCSVCGVNSEYATSYCPNCGTKMESEG